MQFDNVPNKIKNVPSEKLCELEFYVFFSMLMENHNNKMLGE